MSDVLDRIAKLLRLAERASNEHEAALAAERAAALMAEHRIAAAEIRLRGGGDDGGRAYEAAPIDTAPVGPAGGGRLAAWRLRLARHVARAHGIHLYWSRRQLRAYGRVDSLAAAQYVLTYLDREIDRLAGSEARGRGRAYARDWRIGCAQRVGERLLADHAPRAAAARAALASLAPGAEPTTALQVIARDQALVDAQYAKMSANWQTSRRGGGGPGNSGGYGAGYAAGERASIGGARGRLGAGQGQLD